MTKQSKLFPSIAKLCGQLANEQMRRQTWERARALRQEFERRIAGGETIEDAEKELVERMKIAMIEQMRR